jgi:HSP90 family molecular chaperone
MQRLIRLSQDRGGQTPTAFERVLEVNPRSAFIRRLGLLSQNPELDGFIQDCGRQLLDNALVLEGGAVEPQAMVERVQRLMETAAEKSSAIIV